MRYNVCRLSEAMYGAQTLTPRQQILWIHDYSSHVHPVTDGETNDFRTYYILLLCLVSLLRDCISAAPTFSLSWTHRRETGTIHGLGSEANG